MPSLQEGGGVTFNTSFIFICILICKRHFANHVVAPFEANMHVGCLSDEEMPVCGDSYEISFGNFTATTY